DQDLDLGHALLAGSRHHRVKVARGLAVDEVAFLVALPRLDDGEVGDEPGLEDIGLAVEDLALFALGHERADAGLGVEAGDAGAPCPAALGQRALRIEFEFELAGEILAGEFLVLPDIGTDHLPDLPGLQQQAEAPAVDAGIVGDDGKILRPAVAEGDDEVLGNAAEAEAPAHHGHAVEGEALERRLGVGINFVRHGSRLRSGALRCNMPARNSKFQVPQKRLRRRLSRPLKTSIKSTRVSETVSAKFSLYSEPANQFPKLTFSPRL